MNRADQIKFVIELTASIRNSVVDRIKSGDIPEEWNGIELRELLAEKFKDARQARARWEYRRFKAYRNTVIVNNL